MCFYQMTSSYRNLQKAQHFSFHLFLSLSVSLFSYDIYSTVDKGKRFYMYGRVPGSSLGMNFQSLSLSLFSISPYLHLIY